MICVHFVAPCFSLCYLDENVLNLINIMFLYLLKNFRSSFSFNQNELLLRYFYYFTQYSISK